MTWIGDQATQLELVTSNVTYTFSQSSAANTWTITHNLGRFPSVTVVDSANTIINGSVTYNSVNQLTVTFFSEGAGLAISGKAYLN
tara:strand:+ start:523 stop:780 length:258 start_codon:yes stop_codon:yes gene_type:complete